jgi:hypothetical protein
LFSAYQVIVLRLQNQENGSHGLPSNYGTSLFDHSTAANNSLNYYITAEVPADAFKSNTKLLTIGDGIIYKNKYKNAALEKGKRYQIYERALSYHNKVIFV